MKKLRHGDFNYIIIITGLVVESELKFKCPGSRVPGWNTSQVTVTAFVFSAVYSFLTLPDLLLDYFIYFSESLSILTMDPVDFHYFWFYKFIINTELTNIEPLLLRRSTRLHACEPLITAFSSNSQYITFFCACVCGMCSKTLYLIYIKYIH